MSATSNEIDDFAMEQTTLANKISHLEKEIQVEIFTKLKANELAKLGKKKQKVDAESIIHESDQKIIFLAEELLKYLPRYRILNNKFSEQALKRNEISNSENPAKFTPDYEKNTLELYQMKKRVSQLPVRDVSVQNSNHRESKKFSMNMIKNLLPTHHDHEKFDSTDRENQFKADQLEMSKLTNLLKETEQHLNESVIKHSKIQAELELEIKQQREHILAQQQYLYQQRLQIKELSSNTNKPSLSASDSNSSGNFAKEKYTSDLKSQIEILNKSLESCQQELLEKNRNLENLQKENDKLISVQKQGSVFNYEHVFHDRSVILNAPAVEDVHLQEKMEKDHSLIQDLLKSVQNHEYETDILKKDLKEKDFQLSELKKKLNSCFKPEVVQSIKNEHESEVIFWRNALENAKTDLESCENVTKESEEKIKKLEKTIEQLHYTIQSREDELYANGNKFKTFIEKNNSLTEDLRRASEQRGTDIQSYEERVNLLMIDLETKNREISTLNSKISRLSGLIESEASDKLSLESKLNSLKRTSEFRDNELLSLNLEVISLKKEKAALLLECNNPDKKYTKIAEEVRDVGSAEEQYPNCEILQKKISEMETEIYQSHNTLKEKDQAICELMKKIEITSEEAKVSSSELAFEREFNSKLRNAEKNLESKENVLQLREQEMENLKQILNATQLKLKKTEDDNKNRVHVLESMIDFAKENLSKKDQNVSNIQKALDEVVTSLKASKEELEDIRVTLSEKLEELAELKIKYNSKADELQILSESHSTTADNVAILEQKIIDLGNEIFTLKEEMTQNINENYSVISELKNKLEYAETELESKKSLNLAEFEKMKAEHDSSISLSLHLEAKVTERDKIISNLKNELMMLNNARDFEVQELEKKKEVVDRELTNSKLFINQRSKEVDDVLFERDSLLVQLKENSSIIFDLGLKLKEKEELFITLQDDFKKSKMLLEEKVDLFLREKSDLQERYNALNLHVEALKSSEESYRAENEELKVNLQSLKEEIDTLRKHLLDKESFTQERAETSTKLKENSSENETRVKDLENQIAHLEEEIGNLIMKNLNLNQSYSDLELSCLKQKRHYEDIIKQKEKSAEGSTGWW
ncbi:hypothetical protein HDU92_004068 [Lobulomyces angularis]|nr:hypothetical protein HDU92_004068 [Lobulomyces angularis]